MKKLLIAVAVVCALPAVALPSRHQNPVMHRLQASASAERMQSDRTSDSRTERTSTADRAKATRSSASEQSPDAKR